MRLKEHFDLPARFPGYDVEAQLIQDASVLAKTGMHVARSMRVFSDLAPGNLPPVGQLMQRIGSCIVTSARGTAAKLRLLESECQTYIGISFPATSLDKSNRSLLSTPDWGITGVCVGGGTAVIGSSSEYGFNRDILRAWDIGFRFGLDS